MSFKLQEEAEKRAGHKIGNMFNATVALLRKRLLRWLGILEDNLSESDKNKIAREAFEMVSYLMRRKRLSEIVRKQARAVYPEFDPEKYYCKIKTDKKGVEKSRDYIPIEKVPPELQYIRHIWHICEIHTEHVDRWIESLELFADGLFRMTGTAIVEKMLDFTGRTNYSLDPREADEITGELFGGEEEEEEAEDEE